MDQKPDFGRDGQRSPRNIVAYLLLLGARGLFGGIARWAVVAAIIAMYKTKYAKL